MFSFRPLDNSTEGFQNWEFMTAHCWGEQAAGEWTLKIQDTPSQKRDGTEPGMFFLNLNSYKISTEAAEIESRPHERETSHLVLRCFVGTLKKWSLVIYGTAEQPYPVHRERARSAEIPSDSDLTDEYSGESHTRRLSGIIKLPLVLTQTAA